jgi:hypothetical protein
MCPPDRLEDAAKILAPALRAAPAKAISAALYELRTLTRGRDQRSQEDQEAEHIIWIEKLRCWPGDVVMHLLATWPSRANGEFWPTWAEFERELKRLCDQRQAFVRLLRNPAAASAVSHVERTATPEERARVWRHWTDVRPEMAAPASSGGLPEAPEDALARVSDMSIEQVHAELAKLQHKRATSGELDDNHNGTIADTALGRATT